MSDLIDRQDAIELIERMKPYHQGADDIAEMIDNMPSAQPEEDCDTCKHGYFGDEQCNNCRVRYPSHYERRTDEQTD